MTTLNDIATKLNVLAAEVGGDHVPNKETEKQLREISKEVFDLAFEIRKSVDTVLPYLGISDRTYKSLLRQENIKTQEESEGTSKVYYAYLDQVTRYIKYANDSVAERKRDGNRD